MVQGGRRSSSVQLLITPVEAHWRLEEGLGAGGGGESLSSEGLGEPNDPSALHIDRDFWFLFCLFNEHLT